MLDNQKGQMVFECDGCGEVIETGERNMQAAQEQLRAEGWRINKDESAEWQHFCASCRHLR